MGNRRSDLSIILKQMVIALLQTNPSPDVSHGLLKLVPNQARR